MAGGKTHLIEIVEVKVAIAKADSGEHGVVLAVGTVSGDVQEGALRALGFEDVRGGLGTEEKVRLREDGGNGLHFRQDLGRSPVGNTHHQGGGPVAWGFLLAEGEDRSAWCVGNSVGIAEIGVAVFEGVERKKVKRAVGDENQVFREEMRSQWSD